MNKQDPQRGITETEPTGGCWGGGGKNFHKSSGYSPAGSTARTQNKEWSGRQGGWNSPPWADEQCIWPITWSGFGATRAICRCPLHIINTVWTHTQRSKGNMQIDSNKSHLFWNKAKRPRCKSALKVFCKTQSFIGCRIIKPRTVDPVKHIIAFYHFHLAFFKRQSLLSEKHCVNTLDTTSLCGLLVGC